MDKHEAALLTILARLETVLAEVEAVTAEGPRNRDRMQRVIVHMAEGYKAVGHIAKEALK